VSRRLARSLKSDGKTMVSETSDRSKLDQDARTRQRALEAAGRRIGSARRKALFATCRWIMAEGTDGEVEARKSMDRADQELNAAYDLYERIVRGSATGHEHLELLRESQGLLPPEEP
jgi:hypothetical protein